jgi:hypothetical protein
MGSNPRLVLIATAFFTLLMGACSSSSKPSVPTTSTSTSSAPAPATSATSPPASTRVPTSGPRATTISSGPMNLATTAAVRAALVAAFASGQHLEPRYVAGTVKGSVYYAFDGTTYTYWAMAEFSPTPAADEAHKRLDGAPGDPAIQFQDGPWIFSRGASGSWRLVGDTGGSICPPRPPARVLALWGNQSPGCT